MAISDFLLKNFDLVIYLVSLGAANTKIPASGLLPHIRQYRISLGLGHLAPLDFRSTNYQDVHSY